MEPPRNLGILFDSTCRLNDHVNKICQNINYQLYSIGWIRKYLAKTTTEKNDKFGSDIPLGLLQQPSVWYQWILSVLDYYNSLLYGINEYLVYKLQTF